MLDKLRALLAGREENRTGEEPADLPLAVAALLVEAARADETYAEEEKTIIDAALGEKFSLTPEAARDLRSRAEAAQAEAFDLHQFTKQAKTMPHGEKIALIETLWRVVLSDAERDQYEDALIRRICGLIYIDDRESGEARQRIAAAIG